MRNLILILLLIISSVKLYATHAAGMDISYECISQGSNSDTYKITLKFYRDCDGIGAPGNTELIWDPFWGWTNYTTPLLDLVYSSSCGSGSNTLYQVGSAVNINPTCLSYCNGGNTLGIEQYTYETTITLSHCSNWMLSVCEAARNNTINTIINPGTQDLCIQATLNNTAYCNNSPTFSQYPTPFICAGNYYCYNNGAIEIDGDSLVYSLISPLNTANGNTVNYIAPYSPTNPVGGGSNFDPLTGNLCVTPPNILSGVLAIKVEEYRNGLLIGSIIRDIQINAFSCTGTTPPLLTGINTGTLVDINNSNTFTYELNCPNGNQNINFDINTINNNSSNPDAYINMTWDNGIPGANFAITNNNSMNPIGTFNWTPSIADTAGSPYFFTVNISNNACPVPGNFSFQYQVILNGSDVTISPTISNPSCSGLNNGSINTIISGTNTPYTYNWSNGQSTQSISNLNAGTYSLTVTDSLGCMQTETYTLIEPPAFSPTINSYNISCFGLNDGLIEVVNEPSNTTYLWSNSSTASNINNLSPGSYSVNVADSNGCVLTEFFNIIEPSQIIVSSYSNNISCYGEDNGNINLSISGGLADYTVNLPPYSQTLSNGGTTYFSQSILSPGIYNYTVIDANNCMVSDSINITEPSQLTAIPLISNVLCKDENNGSIVLNTNGGTSPYTEDFSGNNPLQLSAGSYIYTITDNNGCIISDTFSISEPDSLLSEHISTDATCAGYFDGMATLSITGGTVPYTTNWFGNNPYALNAGVHNYTITDNNGCVSTGNVIIDEPFGMQMIVNTSEVTCYAGTDGSAMLDISGGAGAPYNTNWGGLNPNSLPAGNHIVTVTDINNCSLTDTITISEPNEILTNPLTTNVSCFGDINGSVYLQLSGGIPPYNQTWFGVDSSYLAPGTYSYEVTDANGCIKNGDIIIYEPDTLKAEATIVNIDCYGNNNGAINLNITGGTSPYSTDFGTFNQYALIAGTYNFTVTDANGCTFDSVSTIIEANQIYIDVTATSPICRYDESILSIQISNALSNTYTILLEDSILKSFIIDTNGLLIPESIPVKLTPNFSEDIHILSLTDNEGCTQTFSNNVHIEVNQLPVLNLNEDDVCVGEPSYTLNNATPSGGSYFINNIMTDYFDVENLDLGNYNIKYEYTDPITSCYNKINETITISASPEVEMLFSPQPANIEDPNILFRDNSNEDIINTIWYLGDGTIIYDELNFWHTYEDIGTYTIEYYITNIYGCSDSVKNNLTINPTYSVFIPDAFTPNNDGDNDFFLPSTVGANSYNIKILDRWGGIIYNEDNKPWDGKVASKPITSGTYAYSITIFDFLNKPFTYTGRINLIR